MKRCDLPAYPTNLLTAMSVYGRVPEELPDDFDASLEYALFLAADGDQRTLQIMRMRFQDNLYYTQIGAKLNVTNERIRQIAERTCAKLCQPKCMMYIQYGITNVIEMESRKARSLGSEQGYLQGYKNGYADGTANRISQEAPITPGELGALGTADTISIEELNLSTRAFNCLWRGGIRTIGKLSRQRYRDLMSLRNFGEGTLKEIVEVMKQIGYPTEAMEPTKNNKGELKNVLQNHHNRRTFL